MFEQYAAAASIPLRDSGKEMITGNLPTKNVLRFAVAGLAALLLCCVFCGAAAADTAVDVYDESALREAVTQPDFNVRLCADIRLTDYYKTGRDNSLVIPPAVTKGTIDLNGHTLLYAGVYSTQSGDNNGAVIIIKSGELTVNDSSSEKTGKITGGRGTHTLMTYGQNYLFGGGVYVADGARLILNGGSISDNRIDNGGMIDAAGAGVYADDYGEVTMNGGSISNNYASAHNGYGAGVHIRRGSFTMTGGTISGNIASSSNSVGGGVYLWGNVKFKMTGGVISGNSANRGGGVYVNSGATFYVGKSVSIMDNSKNDVALIDGHFRTIPKGMLHLTENLNGYVLVAPEDRYRGPSFGTASSGLSPQTERGIINEKNWKYAALNGAETNNLVWGDTSPCTWITLDWVDEDPFNENKDKKGTVAIPRGGWGADITPISKAGNTFTGWYLEGQ
ncbi:MAG TPA: hypothetical protein O0X19_06320, partial [Methanocorpusculum sp.]|nr:hypothetical protein [Methanocorpusculum sp.]